MGDVARYLPCIRCNSPALPALIVLIGAAGSGKTTWASTWPRTQVLELDHFRAMVSDDFSVKSSVSSIEAAPQTLLLPKVIDV
ncbi:AAA family ATPase [Streptomyces sp. NPDC053726]|uniref:AAA family ATPase n=1 Tax=Streptomyces sp. NPDC053726 TaxID=3365713 RepID=UPI0037D85B0C